MVEHKWRRGPRIAVHTNMQFKGQASEGSGPQSDLKINEPACMRD